MRMASVLMKVYIRGRCSRATGLEKAECDEDRWVYVVLGCVLLCNWSNCPRHNSS